jgi:hypothetical protein
VGFLRLGLLLGSCGLNLVVFGYFWLFFVVFCCCWLLVRWVVAFGLVGLGCCSCACGLWRVGRNGEIVGVVFVFWGAVCGGGVCG